MRWWMASIAGGLVLMLIWPAAFSRAGEPSAAERLKAAGSWVSYYGMGQVRELAKFDVVDIDVEDGAANYRADDVAALKAKGKLVVSYLNIGSAEPFRAYWKHVEAYSLGKYPGWPEFYMDVSKSGYRDVILNSVVPQILAKGVDGLFLDNVDAGSNLGMPAVTAGIVELVRQIHAMHPSLLLIAQSSNLRVLTERGADGRQFYQYLNGLAREEVSATYQDGYHRVPAAESDAMLRTLAAWRSKGLTVFTLDYANSPELARYAIERARAHGLVPYVSTKQLDQVFSW